MAYVHRALSTQDSLEEMNASGLVVPFEASERELLASPSPAALAQLIEGEIIPRLLMAHQAGGRSEVIPMTTGVIAPSELSRFARQVMTEDLSTLIDHVDLLMRRGVAVETIYFDLLSPTAKLLGVMWEEDACTFNDVTIGLCRLQQIVYEFADRVHLGTGGGDGRTALFSLTPGDQHSFGLVLVVEFFRRAGWRTVCMTDATAEDLAETVRRDHFDLIGFSMADHNWLEGLQPVIANLRSVSRNAGVRVIVGGKAFTDDPSRVAFVGADETAEDARTAVKTAERLVTTSIAVA
ncbi:cobalamin B12-binding domain-containing protein [Brevundimonas variabilis]|uniref:Methanogenic corrinoid protein MtbC1 n=1 Tax=Brevundimonas variabilis TaxID=74312 RepID=A0A7W9CI47_9CAUL|nr:cobalamin-dependent protein [Brevundimonas variabilis]MBB5746062.1 methanogenic corrinoid protein MtbC1 [Brevundimonas variabilis]